MWASCPCGGEERQELRGLRPPVQFTLSAGPPLQGCCDNNVEEGRAALSSEGEEPRENRVHPRGRPRVHGETSGVALPRVLGALDSTATHQKVLWKKSEERGDPGRTQGPGLSRAHFSPASVLLPRYIPPSSRLGGLNPGQQADPKTPPGRLITLPAASGTHEPNTAESSAGLGGVFQVPARFHPTWIPSPSLIRNPSCLFV